MQNLHRSLAHDHACKICTSGASVVWLYLVAVYGAAPDEVEVGVFNLGFRCGWWLNYLVFCPIKHINTLVFCLKNMI